MRLSRTIKTSFFLCMIIALSSSVFAQTNTSEGFDPVEGYVWLAERCTQNGLCANNVLATTFYALAMKNAGYADSYGLQAVDALKGLESGDHCFPNSGCKVQDTALVLWALEEYGQNTQEIQEYIRDALRAGLTDNWWLEIVTTASNSSCRIGYPSGDGLEELVVEVDQGRFPMCNAGQPETFFDLNSCIVPNLVNNNPGLQLTVDCSTIGPGTIISIVYNSGNTYYLTEQATTARYQTQLQNACHPESKNGACNKRTSLWANYILSAQNSDISTNLYLIKNYDKLDVLDTALLYLSTRDQNRKIQYLEDLKNLQRLDGSFNNDPYQTAIAVLALDAGGASQEREQAIDYLKDAQRSDGSWDQSVSTTAVVLYAAFADASINLPSLVIGGGGGIGVPADVCGDGICQPSESDFSCPQDCESASPSACVENGLCETSLGEDSANCAADCFCGDNKCDDEESRSGICPEDCGGSQEPASAICGNDIREGVEDCDGLDDTFCPGQCGSDCRCPTTSEEPSGGVSLWMWLLGILVLLLIGGGYWFYSKSHGGKKKPSGQNPFASKPAFGTPAKSTTARSKPSGGFGQAPSRGRGPAPRTQARSAPPKKTRAESDLEKSLEEAKKLLGK